MSHRIVNTNDSYGPREGVQQALSVLTGGPLSPELREQVLEVTLRGAPRAKRAWTERGMIEDVSAELAVIGDRDQVEHEGVLRAVFARFLAHATFRVLKGVGHLSPGEAPDALAEACTDLLHRL
jgi:pimeloyl-ACP methyl ester carboxylesterase